MRGNGYAELKGLYQLHEELGSGGFGKVRLGTHLLTGQKVAIKIIDKKSIGDDLPRVAVELEALRTLAHQNICRLYHAIETEEKHFLVMEYCAGGEMFDYIVRKERLEESEARHFFRQLVQAIAFVHHMGYAHRDLKPENLLLTENLQMKLIDFGLCARPGAFQRTLDTCCGSPAYAAPELIKGESYHGNEADIWSMGVLLYALVCGMLPFEDDNVQVLYRKVAAGKFFKPSYLSKNVQDLLDRMLQTDPRKRIRMTELISHPWLNDNYSHKLKWTSVYSPEIVDEDVGREIAHHFGCTFTSMVAEIKKWKFDYTTATYYILLAQKQKHGACHLPMSRATAGVRGAIIASPTIHASLDDQLDRSGIEDEDDLGGLTASLNSQNLSDSPVASGSGASRQTLHKNEQNASYARAMLSIPVAIGVRQSAAQPPRLYRPDSSDLPPPPPPLNCTPTRTRAHRDIYANMPEKENHPHEDKSKAQTLAAPIRINPTSGSDSLSARRGVYHTPQRAPLHALVVPPSTQQRTASLERRCSPQRVTVGCDAMSPLSPHTGDGTSWTRTPRSATKTPRLRQRMFASLERQKEKVKNLLTPRKNTHSLEGPAEAQPEVLKRTKMSVNVTATCTSLSPSAVRDELCRVLHSQRMEVTVQGWKVIAMRRGGLHTAEGNISLELEVCRYENMDNIICIRRRRLHGDAFCYKKVIEDVLRLARLDDGSATTIPGSSVADQPRLDYDYATCSSPLRAPL